MLPDDCGELYIEAYLPQNSLPLDKKSCKKYRHGQKKKSFTTTGWPGCSLSTCFSFGSWHSRPKLPSLPRSLVGRWSPFGCSGLHSAEKERPEGFLREQQPSRYLMRLSPFTRPKVAEAALRSAIPSVVDDSELKGKAKPEPSLSASFPFFEVPIDKRI